MSVAIAIATMPSNIAREYFTAQWKPIVLTDNIGNCTAKLQTGAPLSNGSIPYKLQISGVTQEMVKKLAEKSLHICIEIKKGINTVIATSGLIEPAYIKSNGNNLFEFSGNMEWTFAIPKETKLSTLNKKWRLGILEARIFYEHLQPGSTPCFHTNPSSATVTWYE